MRTNGLFPVVAAVVGTMIAGAAHADVAAAKATVDAAKTAGVVGEQGDGYLGFVKAGDAETKAAVAEIRTLHCVVRRRSPSKVSGTSSKPIRPVISACGRNWPGPSAPRTNRQRTKVSKNWGCSPARLPRRSTVSTSSSPIWTASCTPDRGPCPTQSRA